MTSSDESAIGAYKKMVITIQYVLTVPDSLTDETLLHHIRTGYFGLDDVYSDPDINFVDDQIMVASPNSVTVLEID